MIYFHLIYYSIQITTPPWTIFAFLYIIQPIKFFKVIISFNVFNAEAKGVF